MTKKQTDSKYSIIKFQPKHLSQVMKLFHEAYVGRKMPRSYFKYRFLNSPYGKPLIFLMEFQNQIVGLYAIHPIKITFKGKSILVGYSYLTMTHPSHFGKGIFMSLALKTFEEATKKNYNFIYGFANTNSFPIFKNKLGFVELKPINYIKIKLPTYNYKRSNSRHHHFPRDVGKIWKHYKSKDKFLIKIERNQIFLNWRYKNHPLFKYFTLHKPGEFFFIFKKYENTLHIIDFFGKGNKFYLALLNEATNLAKQLSCKEISMWIPKNHEIMPILEKQEFKRNQWEKSFLIVKILNKKLTKDILDINNWYYSMGDADHF